MENMPKIKIVSIEELTHPLLIRYLASIKASVEFVKKFAKQISYLSISPHRGIGIPNIQNGWQILTPYENGKHICSSTEPLCISHYTFGYEELVVVNNMRSLFLVPNISEKFSENMDYLVLNNESEAIVEDAKNIIFNSKYRKIHYLLSNTNSGFAAVNALIGFSIQLGIDISNHSYYYSFSKDLSEHIISKPTESNLQKTLDRIPDIEHPKEQERLYRGMSM